MKADEIITNLFEDLKNKFDSSLTKAEIKEMKTGMLNKFYKDNMSKYDYELKQYIITNVYDELEKIYSKNNVSDEDKTRIFKSFYRSTYKEAMYKKDKLLIPDSFNDLEYIEQKCFDKDYRFIAAILLQNDNKEDIYNYLKSNIFYQMFKTNHFIGLIKIINRNKNSNSIHIYEGVFEDFCMHDRYFFNIERFLENDCDLLTSNNIISLLKHLNIEGMQKSVGGNQYNKASIINEIINKRKITFIGYNYETNKFTPDLFKNITLNSKGENYVRELLSIVNNDKSKKIKR